MKRRRPHPARRARRVAGVAATGAYAGLLVAIGWTQRASEAETTTPPVEPTSEAPAPQLGVARLDLSATATFEPTAAEVSPTSAIDPLPVPPPPPSVVVTTTTRAPVRNTPAPTPSVAAQDPTPTTTLPAVPTTAAPPATTTPPTVPPTTMPPTTTVPTGGS